MAKAKIVVVRHGEKAGDRITPKGAAQIFAAVENLDRLFSFDINNNLYYSGAHRTRQCALIASAVFGGSSNLEQKNKFNFAAPFKAALNSDMELYDAEFEKITKAGGTVADALMISTYASLARAQLQSGLVELANETQARDVMVFSHSPYSELAVPAQLASNFPYQIGEADTVVYTVEEGVIINAELIKCPQFD